MFARKKQGVSFLVSADNVLYSLLQVIYLIIDVLLRVVRWCF